VENIEKENGNLTKNTIGCKPKLRGGRRGKRGIIQATGIDTNIRRQMSWK
jgi:hypothetical protein